LHIPVFGNGDISTPEQAVVSRKNLNGIMVGRAAAMNPWLMKGIVNAFFDNASGNPPKTPFNLKIPIWLKYLERTARQRGELAACRRFRRYLVFMVSDMNLPAEMRKIATKVTTLSEVEKAMKDFRRFTM
jgi:tRNA-dihydrouridine synthase